MNTENQIYRPDKKRNLTSEAIKNSGFEEENVLKPRACQHPKRILSPKIQSLSTRSLINA